MEKNGQKGVTLLEVVMALAVIAISLLSVVSVIVHTTNLKDSTRDLTISKEAAQARFEEMRDADFATVAAAYNGRVTAVPGLSNGNETITVDATNPDLLDVRIVITWNAVGGVTTYTTRTLITE